MKAQFFIIFAFFQINVFCQTYDLEMKNLIKGFSDGKINENEFTQLSKDWGEILKSFNGYPQLPYNDKLGEIEFVFIKSFKDIDKKTMYDRTMEWSAINFGSLSSALHYSNIDNGKIIFKGNFNVFYKEDYFSFFSGTKKETASKVKCNFSLIITIKDEKLKIEVSGLNFNYISYGYNTQNYYVPSYETEIPIREFYPITNGNPIEWKGRLDLLNQTNFMINSLINNLENYIKNKSLDYNF